MFSQCQAIHARSVFPCQDTPDVKSTFSFSLRSPLPVLASGLPTGASDYQPPKKDGEQGTLKYTFEQKVPINSYLFAVASGDITVPLCARPNRPVPASAHAAPFGPVQRNSWSANASSKARSSPS